MPDSGVNRLELSNAEKKGRKPNFRNKMDKKHAKKRNKKHL